MNTSSMDTQQQITALEKEINRMAVVVDKAQAWHRCIKYRPDMYRFDYERELIDAVVGFEGGGKDAAKSE